MLGCTAALLQVVLPNLPAVVPDVIQQHNHQVLQLLLATLTQDITQATTDHNSSGAALCGPTAGYDQQELCLPLSGCSFAVSLDGATSPTATCSATGGGAATCADTFTSSASQGGVLQLLTASAVQSVLASPLMALSGCGDGFNSLSELLLAGRQWPTVEVRLHKADAPLVAQQDRRGQGLALNAWALDFFKHGQNLRWIVPMVCWRVMPGAASKHSVLYWQQSAAACRQLWSSRVPQRRRCSSHRRGNSSSVLCSSRVAGLEPANAAGTGGAPAAAA